MNDDDFDLQAAWIRKLNNNAAANFHSFAFRMHEAMPSVVKLSKSESGFFRKTSVITAVNFVIGDSVYVMRLENKMIATYVSIVMNGVAIRTDKILPEDWFTKLSKDIKTVVSNNQMLNASLERFLEC